MSRNPARTGTKILVTSLLATAVGAVLAIAVVGGHLPTPTAFARDHLQTTVTKRIVPLSEVTDTRYLQLVNGTHAIPADPLPDDLVAASPTVAVRVDSIRIHRTALAALAELFHDAWAANAGAFLLSSGYRDAASQAEIYAADTSGVLAQAPGHSEHQTGLAADIMAVGLAQEDLAGSPQARWLAQHAPRFGLILRYPEHKTAVTGIAYEPWHFRYVGQPHATFISENDLTLEEYLDGLATTGGYTMRLDGVRFTVSYQIAVDGTIEVPRAEAFTVSSTNTGGYIVTSWR